MYGFAMREGARVICLIGVLLAGSVGAEGALVTGSEQVTGKRTTPKYTDNGTDYGPFEWDIKYTREFDGVTITKDVEIEFVFDAGLGFTDAQKAAYKAAVESGIEGIWNNQFAIRYDTTGQLIPLVVDVTTTGPFDQTVTVAKGPGRADMTHWFDTDTIQINAHEFGHMLGLFDEYIGGAVDKYPNPTLSANGLMGLGALNPKPGMFPRYYQQYLDFIQGLNPTEPFSLVRIPEPTSWMLLAAGFGCVALRRHVRRRPLVQQ